jgi:hypothetical protein
MKIKAIKERLMLAPLVRRSGGSSRIPEFFI